MLMAVRKYRNIGGAVVGALTTCGVLLCTPSLARNTLLLATSGLICGAFLQFGSLVIVLVFLAVSLVSLVAMGVNGDTFSMFAYRLCAFYSPACSCDKKGGKKSGGSEKFR